MTGDATYDAVFWAAMAFAVLVVVTAPFVKSPYGRYGAEGFGPAIHPRWGWILMELPAPLSFVYFFFQGQHHTQAVPLFFLGLWLVHYSNRGWIHPLLMKVRTGSQMSLVVVLTGMVVCTVHGYLNATWIAHLGPLPTETADYVRVAAGVGLYALGLGVNLHSDAILRGLRAQRSDADTDDYKIPYGGAYRWVSSPNYLGELVGWLGFWLATASPGGLFILLVSAGNLLPRAARNHQWYRERFSDYPSNRRALIPGVW